MNKKFIAGLCSCALAVSAMSFSAFAADGDLTSYEATTENVKTIGRTYYAEDTLWLNMSASGVEFTCTGSKVVFNFNNAGDNSRVGFFVNGKLSAIKMVKNKCSVALDLADGENTVKIVKFSEGPQSVLGLDEILVDGETAIAPTADKAHKIEFIGDSITCGYGVEAAKGTDTFSTTNENAAKAYAYQTALRLDADYSLVSASGFGIVSGYTGGDTPNTKSTMPQYYDKLGYSWNNVGEIGLPQTIDWDFDAFTPELVVVNLGTNDASYTKGDAEKCAEYEAGYVAFLKQIREKNPNAKILCTLGVMGQDLYPNIENAVAAYKAETSDENVYSFELSQQDSEKNGLAVDWHPTAASHTDAANELTAEINTLFGWDVKDAGEEDMYTFVDTDEKAVDAYYVTEDSSSESSSDSSSEATSSDVSDADSTGSSTANSAASSKASTSSTANKTTTNPSTGAAAGAVAITAVLAGAVIAVKKRK